MCVTRTRINHLCVNNFFHTSAKSPWRADPSASLGSSLTRVRVGLACDSQRVLCVSGCHPSVTCIRQLRSPWWLCQRAGHKRHSTLKCQSTVSGLGPAFTPPIKTKTASLWSAFHTPFHLELVFVVFYRFYGALISASGWAWCSLVCLRVCACP